ncbi:MAG: 2-oxo acid dehydrogenase subunit E2 [Microbacteriaceae bacterium]|nr:2-oxo acid dehydrogenase subunit E2 [Microbacteriaceae bacterium]
MSVFRLPDLGEGLTEAALVSWLVAIGDEIAIDQPVAEVETAKSLVEVPSPFAGVVTALHGSPGDVLPVGAALIEVGGADPDEPGAGGADLGDFEAHRAEERAGATEGSATGHAADAEGSGNVLIGYGTGGDRPSGRTRRKRGAAVPARREHLTVVPSSPAAGFAPGPSTAAGPVAVRSPIVRRLAQERGVDLHAVTPTGRDGAITRSDVEAAAQGGAVPAGGVAASSGGVGGGVADSAGRGADVVRTEPLGMLRKAVAAKMSRSRAEIPEATVWVDVDVTELWELRRRAAAAATSSSAGAPSFSAILARFVVVALAEYPVLGARLSASGDAIEYLDGVHLGIATNTDRGLLVPVVRHAERLGVAGLDAAIRAAGDAARAGTATQAELSGSTFTLNNYGTLGVDGSAAVINHPEVAILGVGRMIERPWVVEGQIVPRRICQVSLVFDHRVCDGGYAAGFLARVVDAMEHPALFALTGG